jgi:signal transduction histidine kinase/CheY-like chemotaxis protein
MAIKTASRQDYNIEKIIEGINQANIKAVFYFFSPEFEKYEFQKALAKAFPHIVCVGSSMIGGWSSAGAIQTGITAMSLSSDEVDEAYVSFQEGVKEDPVRAAKAAIGELKQLTVEENINPDEYLGLIFFDGLCLGELIMKEFSMEPNLNMAFVGGAAADELTFTKTFVSAGDKLSSDGLVAVILKMRIPFYFDHYVHYLPTETSFTITKVETMHRIVWEINGEPAALFYAKQIGVDDIGRLDANVFAKHPLGLNFGQSVYVRSPNAVIDGRGLKFYCYLEAGTKVYLLKQGNIISNAEKSLYTAGQFLPGIQGCLLFNCVLRYLELKEQDKMSAFNGVFREYPMIGFNTYGEELFTHHNQTLTAVFFGTLPEEGTTDPYKAKRLFHYTDSKLKAMVLEVINKTLGAMIGQPDISKEDIERMLVVYQNNVERTGEYVFNIVDEIRSQNRKLMELRKEAETANQTKSNFLASMSHEIRTPMNAITGMAELLLRRDLPDDAKADARDIKQAASNLISIINDILDFSKIEAGRLELIPLKYMLSSLVNDTINIIRMRLMEKPIQFYTNIDGSIPNNLIGDEVRIRQILLNLLSNAVKYTEKGHIGLAITTIKQESDELPAKVWLKITVTDTGHGIKPLDLIKLFDDFVQVDTKKNRGIEGTGLGLAITKKLCAAMGGDIMVESEYGKGSVFTAIIHQVVDTPEPFAAVEDPESKKVLVYENQPVYAQAICWSLRNMGVPYTMSATPEEFADALLREEWFYVFSSYSLYENIRPVMEKIPGEKRPSLALMIEWGVDAYIPGVRFVSLPAQSLSIADVLNGRASAQSYFDNSKTGGGIRFTLPGVRLLIVDDLSTNLKVAEGLLAPYKASVETCLSGREALELVKQHEYDIVFMDHMMPEMDGIETTLAIRSWETEQKHNNKISIIALTANAVAGMKEMFIENGFNDFLAKPIDVSKLDEMLDRWIPKEKQRVKTEVEEKLVILTDDDPANLRLGKSIQSSQYRVATAPSAEKLFKLLENNSPVLILLDIDMPKMDGYETIKILKSKPETKDIPVVFLADADHDDEKAHALWDTLGAAGHIKKPLDLSALTESIEKYF